MEIRGKLTVSLILFLAFTAGYKGDDLQRLYDRIRGQAAPAGGGSSAPVAVVTDKVQSPEQSLTAAPVKVAPARNPDGNPYGVLPGAGDSPSVPNSPPLVPIQPPTVLPGSSGSLSNTLDAVKPTELSEELKAQRNVYFDRLNQQLAEMKQQQKDSPEPANMAPPIAGIPQPGQQSAAEAAPQVFGQQTGAPPPIVPNAYPVVQPPGGLKRDERDDGEDDVSEDPAPRGNDDSSPEEVLDEDG